MFLAISLNSQENSDLGPATLLKKRLWHSCFPMNFAKLLRTTFFAERLRWLLLKKYGKILHKKMKFSIKDFFSKCHQIRRKLRIWSHLLKKPLMENVIFCEVKILILTQRLLVPSNQNLACELTPLELNSCETSHICHCDFNSW